MSKSEKIEPLLKNLVNKKSTKVEDTHIRRTFLVEKDLSKELDKVANKFNRKGFKTDFINLAIIKGLDEIENTGEEGEASGLSKTKENDIATKIVEQITTQMNEMSVQLHKQNDLIERLTIQLEQQQKRQMNREKQIIQIMQSNQEI